MATTTRDESPGAKRVRRSEPVRTRPIRSGWLSLFAEAPADDAEPRESPAPDDTMARTVELGYRVIDEYIRQGQRAAKHFADRSWGAEALRSDVQDFSATMAHYASEATRLWLDWMGATANADPRGAGAAPPAAERPAAAVDAPAARLSIRLTSARPADVSADLRSDTAAASFHAHDLRAASGAAPRIRGVRVVREDDGAIRICISVPDDQPPGTYSGPVVDAETGVAVGTVRLRIPEP
jgi:hypothetical protein